MVVDVVDLNLKTIKLTKDFDMRRRTRGRKLYEKESVQITRVDNIGDNQYEILANVEGNYGTYRVKICLDGENAIKSSCTCEDYRCGYECKHIMATCLEILNPHRATTKAGMIRWANKKKQEKEEEERRQKEEEEKLRQQILEEKRKEMYQRKYYKALNILKNYETDNFSRSDNSNDINLRDVYELAQFKNENKKTNQLELATRIKLEPKIEIRDNSKILINFKIGQTTMYILKDILELYNSYISKSEIYIGKKLQFIPIRENFETDTDKKLFDFILKYAEIIKYNAENSRYYYYFEYSRKNLEIFGQKIDEFFDIMKERKILIEDEEYTFAEQKLNIKFKIENTKKDEYELSSNYANLSYIISSSKIYYFYNNKIYEADKTENQEIIRILKYLDGEGKLLIPKDKMNEFSAYVLPKIEKSLEVENIKEATIVNKLSAKIYLDLDDKANIIMQLKFCYLNYEFNILENDYKKYVMENQIIRNIPKEKEIITRIFMDGFQLVKNKNYFVLENEDYIYDFLVNKVQGYMNDFEVLVTEKFKTKKVKEVRIPTIGIKLQNGLLEVDLSKINIDMDEIQNVLKNYNIKKKYYKLKNGEFLKLNKDENLDFLNDISSTFDYKYTDNKNGIITLPTNRSIYLEKLIEKNKSITTNSNDAYTKLINNVENKDFSENIKIEENFDKVLRNYQKVGYKWLKTLEFYGFGGILADDMGLGKTLQIIALISSAKNQNNTSIVVCPSSLVLNWKNEINKWDNELKVLEICGNFEIRKNLIDNSENYDVIITSYDSLKRDIEQYENKFFKYIIADEAQYIKNFSTQNATALKSLKGECKFALTGTPIENSIAELWSIFDFVMPGYLYNYNKFKRNFEAPILKEESTETLERLKILINPFILRRIKKDVLTELPDKSITIMNNEMTEEQEKIYLSYLAQTKKEIAEELQDNSFEKSKFKILMLLTRLRQICCHPSLFIDNYYGGSGKLEQCIELIEKAIEAGHKILLFSSYTSMFEIIEKSLNKRKIKYLKLTGATKVDSRIELVDEFNNNDDIKIFLISLKAGGTGLNLTSADVVIHYDPWWNVSSENQATDRAYRIGQKNNVQVYKLITKNSIEEKINLLQEKKSKVSENLLSTETKFINKLSKEEIMDLFQ